MVDSNKTVILTLVAAKTSPPNYQVGFPNRAAALIIDSGAPHPRTAMLRGT
jgi:hypothetical protein